MRLHIISILGASMLATAGVNANSANLAGAFDLQGCQAKCAPGADACLTHCQAQHDCWANKSVDASQLNNCLSDAQRAFDLAAQGGSVAGSAAANASGEKSVSTDADNANSIGHDDDHKGFDSAGQ